jgi:hypothetical protein
MRAQGINIPDLTPGGGRLVNALRVLAGYSPTKVQAADKACAGVLKQAFPNLADLTPAQVAQRRRQAIAFAQCMRARGIAFPDPGNPAAVLKAVASIDTNSPAYLAAAPVCRAEALKAGAG